MDFGGGAKALAVDFGGGGGAALLALLKYGFRGGGEAGTPWPQVYAPVSDIYIFFILISEC